MKYHNVELTKRESEIILFLQTGSNNFWDAYYNYEVRKKRMDRPTLTISSWFNSTLKGLHQKKLFTFIPFVLILRGKANNYKFIWQNPGINASKANFEAFTLHDAVMEHRIELQKIL